MRSSYAILFLALFLLACPGTAAARDWSLASYEREGWYGWDGFAIGTSVRMRTTTETSVPQMPEPVRNVHETRETLVKKTSGHWILEIERRKGEITQKRVVERERPKRRARSLRFTELTESRDGQQVPLTERLTIEDATYVCRLVRVERTDDQGEAVLLETLWVHAEHGILKTESAGRPTSVMSVSRLRVPTPVGEQILMCRELHISTVNAKGTMLWCPDVPGMTVRQEMEITQGAATRKVLHELVELVRK